MTNCEAKIMHRRICVLEEILTNETKSESTKVEMTSSNAKKQIKVKSFDEFCVFHFFILRRHRKSVFH